MGREGEGSSGSVRDFMGALPPEVGTGDYRRPLMEGVLQGMKDLALDVQEMKAVVIQTWELERGSEYVKKAMEMKEAYVQEARSVKGQGVDLGHMKNWVFVGLWLAMLKDRDVSTADMEEVNRQVGELVKVDGRVMMRRAKEVARLVAYCQVTRTPKKAFLNIAFVQGSAQERLQIIFERVMQREGVRRYDVAPLKPMQRELNEALMEGRKDRPAPRGRK